MANDRFKKARMRAFVRDAFRCQFPGCTCRRLRSLTAHHLLPRSEGGRSVPENLATMCEPCHSRLHQDPEEVARFRQQWQARQPAAAGGMVGHAPVHDPYAPVHGGHGGAA